MIEIVYLHCHWIAGQRAGLRLDQPHSLDCRYGAHVITGWNGNDLIISPLSVTGMELRVPPHAVWQAAA